MHRNATEIFTHNLTLSGVHAGANVNAELFDRVGDRLAAPYGTRRTVKGCQKAVARRVDFSTSVPLKLLTNNQVVLSEEVLPCAVAKFDNSPGCANDIREKYACEHAVKIKFNFSAPTGQERFTPPGPVQADSASGRPQGSASSPNAVSAPDAPSAFY